MIMRKTLLVLACIASVVLCSSSATVQSRRDRSANDERELTTTDYLIGADDVVRITVEKHPEWSGEYLVRPDGTVIIQGLGTPKLDGLSQYGAEILLLAELERYIKSPHVSVEIVRYASQSIYVLGEVNSPGKYPTSGKDLTLRDAIILAGLPGRFPATRRVYIISPSRVRARQRVVDLERVLYRGELKNNVRLNPGDIVYVPQTFWGHISTFISTILSPVSSSLPAARAAVVPVP